MTAAGLSRTTAMKHSSNNLLHCPVLSCQGEGGGSTGYRMSERKGGNEKGSKEIKRDCSQGMCTPSLFCGKGWVPCVSLCDHSEMVPGAASLPHCCTVLRHRETRWRLLTRLPLETKLGSAATREFRRGFVSPPRWDNGCCLIPREE